MNRTADAVGLLTYLVTDEHADTRPASVAEAVRIACDIDVDDPTDRMELFAATVATIARVPTYGHIDLEELLPSRGNLVDLLDRAGDGATHLLADRSGQLARLTRSPATFHSQLGHLLHHTVEVIRDLDEGLQVLTTLGSLSNVVEVSERALEEVFARHGDEALHELIHTPLPVTPTVPGDPARVPQLRAGAALLEQIVHAHNLGEGTVVFEHVTAAEAAGALVAAGAVHAAVREAARRNQEDDAGEEELEELDHLGPPGEDLFPVSLLVTLVASGHDEHARLWTLAEQLAADGAAGVCARLEAGFCTYGGDLDELVIGEHGGFVLLLAGLAAARDHLDADLCLDPSRFDTAAAAELLDGDRRDPTDVEDVCEEATSLLADLPERELRRRLRQAAVDPVAARWILDHLF